MVVITKEGIDPFVTNVLEKVEYKVIPVKKLPEVWYESHLSYNTFSED